MFKVLFAENSVKIEGVTCFSLPQTLDCGQAFRWKEIDENIWQGVAFDRLLTLEKNGDCLIFHNTTKSDFLNVWQSYFDLDRDYDKIITEISGNEILKKASSFGGGIRILNQEPWETLCSFIISQNNNIKRIKGIVERLCATFGEDMGGYYTFPTAEKIAKLTLDDLSVLRAGFRAKYILDAAQKIASGQINLPLLKELSYEDAKAELMKIKGVGPKVADCTLLFSLGKISAFPQDVWIKRAMQVLFDGRLPEEAIPYAGIVQQYIFYYARETKLQIE